MIGIYKITNKINNKSYIGQSNNIHRRWREHRNNIGSNKNPLYLDFQKYGLDNFSFEVLEECCIKDLDYKEIEYIKKFDTYNNGYNLTAGGQRQCSFVQSIFPQDVADFISQNSMHLFYLLWANSYEREFDYFFMRRDFTVNKIKEMLHMHPNTIKKYWKLLEDNKLIKYEGPAIPLTENWDKGFMARKKDGATYYTIQKSTPYRIMPRETLDKIQYDYLVDEQELKLYLLLAEMQERFCYFNSCERAFTLKDLRDLLKLTKHKDNNKALINGLIWLQKLDLIDYDIELETTNLGTKMSVFYLKTVNYYTNGGEAVKYLGADGEKISEKLKNDLLNNNVIEIFD